MDYFKNAIGTTVIGLIGLALLAILIGLPLMLLWNWLMPAVFGLSKIAFWQSVGLYFLSGILFRNNSSKSKK